MNSHHHNRPSNGKAVFAIVSRIIPLLGIIAGIYFASTALIPIVLAYFTFVFINPIVESLQKHLSISRTVSAPFLLLCTAMLMAVVCWSSYGAVTKIARNVPMYSEKIKVAIQSVQNHSPFFQNIFTIANREKANIQKVEIVDSIGGTWEHVLLRGLDSGFTIVSTLLLIPILTLFMLLDKPLLKTPLIHSMSSAVSLSFISSEAEKMVRGFFLGNFVIGVASTIAFFVLFQSLKLENAIPLAFVSGFAILVPFIGPVIALVFPLAQALLQFETLAQVIVLLAIMGVLQFIVSNLVIPKVVGAAINLNATFATLGLIIWGWLWGGVGLLLAVPLTAMIRILLASHQDTRSWANLMTGKPVKKLQTPSAVFLAKSVK